MSKADLPEEKLRKFGEISYRAAVRTAIVAAVFCLFVGGLLIYAAIRSQQYDILRQTTPITTSGTASREATRDREFATLLDRLKRERNNAELRRQIRELDVRLRREYEQHIVFVRTGAVLLLGGACVFIASMIYAAVFRRSIPAPGPKPKPHEERRIITRARWAVSGAAGILVCAAISASLPRPAEQSVAGDIVPDPAKQWPCFRGPGGRGVSHFTNVPDDWDGPAGRNILWKTPVPLPGKSSPIVWGNRVFLSGADKSWRDVYCFDADTGVILWRQAVRDVQGSPEEPPDVDDMTGYAAPTMATDGRHACAIFANGDIAAFDFSGRRLWARNLGIEKNIYGHASSLLIWKNLLIVQLDQGRSPEDNLSVITALKTATGELVWETKRPVRDSWSSPILISVGTTEQIITCGPGWLIAYDPASGAELWRAEYADADIGPSPTFSGGRVYAANPEGHLIAVRPDGTGDVTKTHVDFRTGEYLPDIVSPLVANDLVFLVTGATITCYDATNGSSVWEHSFESSVVSSPSLVGDKVYVTDTKGITHIIRAARKFESLGQAKLGEGCETCLAFADGRIYIRGEKHLFCIGKPDERR